MQNNRLMKEYREVSRGSAKRDPEISLSLENDNSLLRWRGVLQGPPGTPYEGGRFELKIVCTSTYPLTPPKVQFVTNVFHPNVLFKVRAPPVRMRDTLPFIAVASARFLAPPDLLTRAALLPCAARAIRRRARSAWTSSRRTRGRPRGRCSRFAAR
jgi:hypothetical protein